MANHQSAIKRIRQNETKRMHNKYYAKSMRNALRDFRALTDRKQAEERFPKLASMIDKLVKDNIIHKNKAANLKSKMAKQVSSL